MSTQVSDLVAHLKSGQAITAAVAMSKFGIVCLQKRLLECKPLLGKPIKKRWLTITSRHARQVRVLEYRLGK